MLTHTATWTSYVGQDKWGNNVYRPAQMIMCFVTETAQTPPSPDSQNRAKSDSTTLNFITDSYGIGVGDRITIDGLDCWVTNQTTHKDEVGDVVQLVTIQTQEEN